MFDSTFYVERASQIFFLLDCSNIISCAFYSGKVAFVSFGFLLYVHWKLQHVIFNNWTSRFHFTADTMASTASPHWEVVGKGKKSKIPTPVSRGERKKLVDGMPKVEHYGKNQQVSTSPLFFEHLDWIMLCNRHRKTGRLDDNVIWCLLTEKYFIDMTIMQLINH